MTSRGTLNVVERKIRGTVKGGVIVVEDALAEGAEVTVLVEEKSLLPDFDMLDSDGNPMWTPEQLAEIEDAEAQADRGEGIPWEVVRAELWPKS